MQVCFRADASLDIGSGHVMRCLTLADALVHRGASVRFIARAHEGHLADTIRQRGHQLDLLPTGVNGQSVTGGLTHAPWLGATQEDDAAATGAILVGQVMDWMVVDHYALDHRWESSLRGHCRNLMVIDDLADRRHDCDLLLDQNLGRDASDYAAWVPEACRVMIGPAHALLRPEFAAWRGRSLERRSLIREIETILVNLGGVDKDNVTLRVLEALQACDLPQRCRIVVVMGAKAPGLSSVKSKALEMPWPTEVLVSAGNMAELMASADLAIGAAGSTAWERCCLGLPSLLFVLADNQHMICAALAKLGAAQALRANADLGPQLSAWLSELMKDDLLCAMGKAAAEVTDGLGARRIVDYVMAH
jgi:UDP-2,4-diacetamido-2,4,6-trideoxy-beta-L-altropyranose hydrolase